MLLQPATAKVEAVGSQTSHTCQTKVLWHAQHFVMCAQGSSVFSPSEHLQEVQSAVERSVSAIQPSPLTGHWTESPNTHRSSSKRDRMNCEPWCHCTFIHEEAKQMLPTSSVHCCPAGKGLCTAWDLLAHPSLSSRLAVPHRHQRSVRNNRRSWWVAE